MVDTIIPVEIGVEAVGASLPIREIKKQRGNGRSSQRASRTSRGLSFHFKRLVPPTFTQYYESLGTNAQLPTQMHSLDLQAGMMIFLEMRISHATSTWRRNFLEDVGSYLDSSGAIGIRPWNLGLSKCICLIEVGVFSRCCDHRYGRTGTGRNEGLEMGLG
ncbi:hypothetical protein DSL72_001805 [Monilinia vaccinii-corymbosi]|uniref:Uncharacterized protein n=1 Tax=Monilinia vaccinii-corymbosi TaxID=61207 RepID=A0A8A3PAV2_9HELO|nr:hypothetical protein DSL72_001805 [Monilinia vaccinii-corymbosi]